MGRSGEDETIATATALRDLRRRLNDFCRAHAASVAWFRHLTKPYFRLDESSEESEQTVRHLTSSATCLESLLDAREAGEAVPATTEFFATFDLDVLIASFATGALERPDNGWLSEGSAHVYCRVRTLPIILRCSVTSLDQTRLHELIAQVWNDVATTPNKQGVREHAIPDDDNAPHYPPNTFQTFWALQCLRLGRAVGVLQKDDYAEPQRVAELWARTVVGDEISLHSLESRHRDPHRLAWGIACLLTTDERPTADAFTLPDLLDAALRGFFAQQLLPSGVWPRGQPLFHYQTAGNAYPYTFETLTELLRPALSDSVQAHVLRTLLRRHWTNLARAFDFASQSAIPLGDGAVGWCSQHHPQRVLPEAWATAAVFAFAQAFRCLVGIWSREDAENSLVVREPKWPDVETARRQLDARGATWCPADRPNVAEVIASMFINPMDAHCGKTEDRRLDPDRPLIDEDQARSAILFGPPGTSKTTIVEAVAGALGWRFVAVHASDFLSAGIDRVPSRADDIFLRLMELDHCVVLFDEIDELLRDRGDASDPYGRFLTTSMLPKVARLWEQRRILFFVATNDLVNVDPAIRRSQRFDARIFVPSPSLAVKRTLVTNAGLTWPDSLDETTVEATFDREPGHIDDIGFVALLRYDQVQELIDLIRSSPNREAAPLEAIRQALGRLDRDISASDWAHAEKRSETQHPQTPLKRFTEQRDLDGRDHRMRRVLRIDQTALGDMPAGHVVLGECDGVTYVRVPSDIDDFPSTLQIGEATFQKGPLLTYRPPVAPDGS